MREKKTNVHSVGIIKWVCSPKMTSSLSRQAGDLVMSLGSRFVATDACKNMPGC